MIVITIELMKLQTRGGSSSKSNDEFKKQVIDIKQMAKGISIKDDILDFEIGTKMTKEVEMILRRPLVNMDVQDVSLAEVENRNSKLMQEEICKLIFDKLKENMQKLSINYNITPEKMAITIDKLIKEENHISFMELVEAK